MKSSWNAVLAVWLTVSAVTVMGGCGGGSSGDSPAVADLSVHVRVQEPADRTRGLPILDTVRVTVTGPDIEDPIVESQEIPPEGDTITILLQVPIGKKPRTITVDLKDEDGTIIYSGSTTIDRFTGPRTVDVEVFRQASEMGIIIDLPNRGRLVADFDSMEYRNNLDAPFGTFTQFTGSEAIQPSFATHTQEGDYSLKLDYDFQNHPDEFGGFYNWFKEGDNQAAPYDVSNYSEVAMDLRTSVATSLKVELKDVDTTAPYLVTNLTGGAWQTIAVPFASFDNSDQIDRQNVTEFTVVLEESRVGSKGSVEIDNLKLQ